MPQSRSLRDPHTTSLRSSSPIRRSSLSPSPAIVARDRRGSSPLSATRVRRSSSSTWENGTSENAGADGKMATKNDLKHTNGTAPSSSSSKPLREISAEPEEMDSHLRRRNPPRSTRAKSPALDTYNGLPTLDTIPDPSGPEAEGENGGDGDSVFAPDSPGPSSPSSPNFRPPPPAPSAALAKGVDRPVTRQRRSSSIKRKLSPGVTPTKAVDWEIPRKAFHSSIGFVTLYLKWLDPPTLRPLITVLSAGLAWVLVMDFFRLRYHGFAETWEAYFGFLMRESERDKINGVVWYLVGVIFVLGVYPRDIAVVSILTLSWSDTTASTIGRLYGRRTPPLPAHFPGIKALKFAPRKSFAGFLAATITGFFIGLFFWLNGSQGAWHILDGKSWLGLLATATVVGAGGAVVEALDLGVDDNLTLPILSGALIWGFLATTNALF